MLLCLAVTIGFRDTKRMGNASGMAIIYELVNPSMFDILVYFRSIINFLGLLKWKVVAYVLLNGA